MSSRSDSKMSHNMESLEPLTARIEDHDDVVEIQKLLPENNVTAVAENNANDETNEKLEIIVQKFDPNMFDKFQVAYWDLYIFHTHTKNDLIIKIYFV